MINTCVIQVLENKFTNNEANNKRLLEVLFMTQEYLNLYNISEVEIRFTKNRKVLGLCSYSGDVISLNLNHALFDPIDEVKETILHEIAHALTSWEGHFLEWQIKAIELGLSYQHIQRYKQL